MVAIILAAFQLHEYRALLQEGQGRAQSRAGVAAEWVHSVFDLSDMALQGLEELSQAPLVAIQGDTVDSRYLRLEQVLADRRDRFSFLEELGLFDAQGRVVATSSPLFPRGYDLGGLNHYRVFREQPALEEWVTGLYWSSFANDYRIIHVQRVDSGEASAVGLVAAMLTPRVFHQALTRRSLASGQSLMLVDSDWQVVMRYPECEGKAGCLTTGDAVPARHRPEALGQAERPGSFRMTSPLDDVERLYSMATVEGLPFRVIAGESVSTLLAGWWQNLWLRVVTWLLFAGFGALILRHYLSRLHTEQQARIAATAFESQLGMLVTDGDGRILRVNRAFTRITGYPESEVLGRRPSLLASGQHDDAFYRQMWQAIHQTGSWEGEVWNRRRSGELYPEHLMISAVTGSDGRVTHYVGAMNDISLRKAAEDEAHHLAFFDPLTGLPNRRQLFDRLAAMAEESRPGGHLGALLLIDLDHFKRVNDLLGHQQGDQLLQRITSELRRQSRDSDTLFRLSGDEFAVLLMGLGPDQEHAAYIAERIAAKLTTVLQLSHQGDAHAVRVTASIGVALFRLRQVVPQTVMQQADIALQQAKQAGRQRFCFFDPTAQQQLRGRISLEADLVEALPRGEFRLHYQAQVGAAGRLLGAEVLLRWEHPTRGMVSPAEFIPLAEETGQIVAIDRWVLETACHQLAAWAHRPETSELTLSVNISAQQFKERDFVDVVRQILNRTKAPPGRLKLEVTEGLFLERQDEARDKIIALKASGLTFALDDFGTGFSSLSYLSRLPLDQLKIDQSFVREVIDDAASAAIVESTIALAHSLELEVIAEGVETEAQRAWLKAHGCECFQGYLFGRPVPVDEFEKVLIVPQLD